MLIAQKYETCDCAAMRYASAHRLRVQCEIDYVEVGGKRPTRAYLLSDGSEIGVYLLSGIGFDVQLLSGPSGE